MDLYVGDFLWWTVCPRMDYLPMMKSQWKMDIMEVRKYYLQRAYRATGPVTKCGPYEHNNGPGENQWLKLDGSRPDGSRPEMDCGRRSVKRDESRLEMVGGRTWITTGYGWITGGGWWEMDDRRLISGAGSWVTNDNQSPFAYEATNQQSNADLQTYGDLAARLHRVRYRAPFSDAAWCTYMPKVKCRIPSRIRFRVTAAMWILHKVYEINLWRSKNLKRVG